jgi:triosephosphate isomerase
VSAARKPLIAGNWKMHNNHFEAIALTQKLGFALTDKDFTAVDVAVLPPFTALRSVQTLIDGDKLRLLYGAQDVSPHEDGAYTGDIWPSSAASSCWRGTRSGGSITTRTMPWSMPRSGCC